MRRIQVPSYKELSSPPIPRDIQISVCITNYGRTQEFIESCIEEYFRQNFPKESFEVILVDDNSSDTPPNVPNGLESVKRASTNIINKYSNYNFRMYLLTHTRTCDDTHTFNVAFKHALGWILILNQVDVIPIGEVLEATWRHHNARDKLWLCPKSYCEKEFGSGMKDAPPWHERYLPHEFGASVRKKYVVEVGGRDERIRYPHHSDVDFHNRLGLVGVNFAEDKTISSLHRYPDIRHLYSASHFSIRYPKVKDSLPPFKGEWGSLTSEEENSALMTPAMKKVYSICKTLK